MTQMETKVAALLKGVSSVLPAGSSIVQAGQTLTQASLQSTLTGYLGLYTAVDAAEQSLGTARSALKAQATAIHQYVTTVNQALRTFFGPSSPQLAQFGLTPRGATKTPSPETKALATAKRMQTRKARGIMGKVQRSQISATPGPTLVILGPNGQPLNGDGATSPTPATVSPTPAK